MKFVFLATALIASIEISCLHAEKLGGRLACKTSRNITRIYSQKAQNPSSCLTRADKSCHVGTVCEV